MSDLQSIQCDVAVIGAGMAGMAAALYAANRGLSTVLLGSTSGATTFASGLLDLLGVYPAEQRNKRLDPWEGIAELAAECPAHPFAMIPRNAIREAFAELLEFLKLEGLDYCEGSGRNFEIITAMGTSKPTYIIPFSMQEGANAFREHRPCLLIDFHGMKEYSALQIASVLSKRWPALRSKRIEFPAAPMVGELYTTSMADALESPAVRAKIAEAVRRVRKGDEVVGFPAILGMSGIKTVFVELQDQIGAPVFEIPTLPPSVPGLRLKEALTSHLTKIGVKCLPFFFVSEAREAADGGFELIAGGEHHQSLVRSRGVILATGRFLGKGLLAERQAIREAVFDLPVYQPDGRKSWHRGHFFSPKGHAVNRSGLVVDESLRPVREDNTPAFQTLFAVGSILAHQDWARTKSGAGLAIATAYQAVKACCGALGIKTKGVASQP